MSDNKPVKVYYFWKYADEPMSLVKKTGVTGRLAYGSDSDAITDGVQNDFRLEGIRYRSTCPAVDVFAVGINAEGQGKSPGFWNSGDVLTITEAGGIDGVETEFDVLGDEYAAMLATGNHLETSSGEIMRVEGITPGSPNYTITVERGAHATTAAAALFESELEILTPNCGMERITLTGDITALDPPVLDSVNAVGEGLLLQWSHSYTGDDLAKLSHFKVYYSDAAAIDISDPGTYDGTFEVAGNQNIKVFNPLDSNLPDVNTTFYFVVTAITQAQIESVASNELSGKAFGSIQPNPTGPPTPTVTVEVNGSYRLKVEAKKPTGTDSALGVSNVKKATIEVYYATAGLGNPTDGTPDGNQTLINSYEDSSLPYSVEIGVSGYGYKDYWARAYFTDGDSVDGSYGLSAVFELNAENNTTDTGVSTGVYVSMLVDTGSPFDQSTSYYANVAATGNTDSAKRCQIAFRVDGAGTFEADQDTPFTGATAPESVPKTYGGYPGINHVWLSWDHTWEITARIYNAYGWTDWITPESITLTKELNTTDTGTCDLAGFGAWTLDSPHPSGWSAEVPEPAGQQVTFTFALPTTNASTVWSIGIEGTTAASFPTETVAKNQADGTAVTLPGSYEAVITFSAYSPTSNEFAGKFFRKGLNEGKNENDNLQVLAIASNTAGSPCTITFTGQEQIRNLDPAGSVDNWEIITKPIWSLLDFNYPMDVHPGKLGAVAPLKYNFKTDATGMKFRACAHNVWGIGGRRESTAMAAGSATPGTAVYKIIGGLTDTDVKPASLTYASVVEQLQPLGHTVVFTALTYRTFSWAAGTVKFPGGVSRTIDSGSSATLTTNTTYWAYYTPGSTTLGVTNSLSVAIADGKTILAVIRTTSAGDEFCTIIPRWGPGVNIGAASIVCDQLSAITADLGTINAGTVNGVTIQTSATASTNGGIVLNGTDYTLYDTDGDKILSMDKTNGLIVYDSAEAVGLQMNNSRTGGTIFVYNGATLVGRIARAAGDHLEIFTDNNLILSSDVVDVQTNMNVIQHVDFKTGTGSATSYLKMRGDAGIAAIYYCYIDASGNWVVDSSPP